MQGSTLELDLPGFRFHPTEEELIGHYLRHRVSGKKLELDIIGNLNIYMHDPWDLPSLSKIGEREWYFFVPRNGRHSSGGRPKRTTQRGFWKATGSDRPVWSAADSNRLIGVKKTLVFYMGRAPRGTKTDWVMNEFCLCDRSLSTNLPFKDDIVLCKVYRKATPLKVIEKRAAMRAETMASIHEFSASMLEIASNSELDNLGVKTMPSTHEFSASMLEAASNSELDNNPPHLLGMGTFKNLEPDNLGVKAMPSTHEFFASMLEAASNSELDNNPPHLLGMGTFKNSEPDNLGVKTMPSTYEFSVSMLEAASISEHDSFQKSMPIYDLDVKEMEEEVPKVVEVEAPTTSLIRSVHLPELQIHKCSLGWIQDTMLSQLHSPWFEQWSSHADILKF